MSADAERYVQTCTQLKGGTYRLLDVIARAIPEGHATTPLIGMPDLAARAGLTRRTVLRRVKDLIDLGMLDVVDGGQGRVARYRIVPLDGERPITAVPLPLRADLRPVAGSTPLFDPAEAPVASEAHAKNMRQKITSWLWLPVTKDHKFRRGLSNMRQIVTSWWTVLATICHRLLPLAVDDARARDVHTFKNVHTHTAPPDESPPATPRSPLHPWHAWCDGLVHVPKILHEEFVRKHRRRPGETDTDVARTLFAFYAVTCAALPSDCRVVEDDFAFWRVRYRDAFADAPARAPTAVTRAEPSDDVYARGVDYTRRRRGWQ